MIYRQIINKLTKLVNFPTVSNRSTEEITAYLAETLETIGFQVAYDHDRLNSQKANLFATIGPENIEGLLLSGHMDVVPTDGQNWQSDPFKLVERENKLYGRGCVDMKGFIATVISVLENLEVKKLKKELTLLWTYDEEIGCLGSRQFVNSFWEKYTKKHPLPKFCIIGEPTEQKMITSHNGIFLFDVILKGKAAHSSVPSWGINAILDAKKVIDVLVNLSEAFKQTMPNQFLKKYLENPYTTINIATIEGGLGYNIVPEACQIGISVRPIPGVSVAEVKKMIFSTLQGLSLPSEITIIEGISSDGLNTDCCSDSVMFLKPYVCASEPEAVAYCTDGGNLAQLGIEPIIFGPGSIKQAHKADEYIEAKEIVTYANKLTQIIQKRLL